MDRIDYVVHRSRGRVGVLLGVLAVLCLALLLVDYQWLADLFSTRRSGRIVALGWAARTTAVIGLLVVLAKLPSLLRSPVEIAVAQSGILYPPALIAELPWDRVERTAVRKIGLFRVLAVFIVDADNFPIRPLARKTAQLNKLSGDLGDINIETTRSDGDFDALLEAVSQYREVEPMR